MKAYWFRFTNDTERWVGLAVASDWVDLFWQIDSHGDPFSCEIKKVKGSASVCVQTFGEEDEAVAVEIHDPPEKGWKRKQDWYDYGNLLSMHQASKEKREADRNFMEED